jgi:hypothetical protein
VKFGEQLSAGGWGNPRSFAAKISRPNQRSNGRHHASEAWRPYHCLLGTSGGCKASAAETSNAIIQAQLLNLEAQWRHLAKSYEFVASLERFLIDVQRNALPNNEENLPRNPDI